MKKGKLHSFNFEFGQRGLTTGKKEKGEKGKGKI
jgi:hypothetical protein